MARPLPGRLLPACDRCHPSALTATGPIPLGEPDGPQFARRPSAVTSFQIASYEKISNVACIVDIVMISL